MANWSIANTAPEIEKIKAEMADYLHGLNSCAEIDYSIYSQLFDFSLPLIQKAYELGKKEAKQCNIAIVSGSYYWVKLMSDDKYEPAIAINLLGVMNFQFFNGVAVPCYKVNGYSECNYR